MRWISAAKCVSGVVVLSILAFAVPAQGAFPGQNGGIAFVKSDGDKEIWTMNADGTGQVQLTSNTASDINPTWSPDGKWIAFASNRDGNFEIYVMSGNGGNPTRLTNNAASDVYPSWSPGAERIAFQTNRDGNNEIYAMNADGTAAVNLTNNSADDSRPAWKPDGSQIGFVRGYGFVAPYIYQVNPSGGGPAILTSGYDVSWGPQGQLGWMFYYYDEDLEQNIFTVNWENTGWELWEVSNRAWSIGWSPDGEQGTYDEFIDFGTPQGYVRFRFLDESPVINGTGEDLDWQPVNPGYARPVAATPAAVQLVPTQKPCGNPNGSHNGPLAAPSCSPAVQTSDYLTVGGADGQPSAPRFHGIIDFKVLTGNAATFADEADLRIVVKVDDVRRKSDYLDYEGELQASLPVRITDRWNGPSLNQAGTASDLPLSFAVPCSATTDTSIGSTCSVTTTADSIAPGAVREGRRAVWELNQVQVFDGGADADADTPGDNTLFATQGLFAP
jgi:hypothetical protein